MNKIDMIKNIISKDETDVNAWYLLAIEYKEDGQNNEALKALTEALKYCDDDFKIKIIEELGSLSLNGGNNEKTEEATKCVPKATEVSEKETIKITNEDVNESSKSDKVIPFGVIKGSSGKGEEDTVSFKDVGGLEEVKKVITMKIIKPFEDPNIFLKFNKKIGGGILLYGPPGCGKTFIAKATAGQCGANFMNVRITDILDKYIGESEQNIKRIFDEAKEKKPSIVFFDEIDTLGYNRNRLHSEYLRGVIDQFLYEMDGVDSGKDKVLVFGATNMPWDIDAAFKRPGRFDRVVFVPPPDSNAREAIFKLKLKDRPADNINFAELAKLTELYSGADIENVVEVVSENVIEEIMNTGKEREINTKDIVKAIKETKPSTLDWLRTIKNYVTYANQNGMYDEVKNYLSKCRI